jgi:hypothetical protein
MKRFICGIILGSLLVTGLSYGYRIPRPQRITDFDQNGLIILNENLEHLWDVTNGRYSLDIVTVNPDGTKKGDVGDMLLLNNGGTYYLEICVGGKIWFGEELSNTP